eukprot:6212371-Pleurochrysis_carterae.AAC.2
MTGQHALRGRGYDREGYADNVYAPAGGDCAFDRQVSCRIPGRDCSSELPGILYCKPETVVDIRDILKKIAAADRRVRLPHDVHRHQRRLLRLHLFRVSGG